MAQRHVRSGKIESKIALQDGAMFFDIKNYKTLAHYPEMVSHDFDMAGAKKARTRFLKENPDYSVL